jgi:nucleotide-binding universal stress UspA family protein
MFTQIIVPVDLSNRYQPALDLAARLVNRDRGEVTSPHVIRVMPGLAVDDKRDCNDDLERRARAYLIRLGEGLAQHVPSRLAVAYGQPVVEIMHDALKRGPDLPVLTTHRIDSNNGQVWDGVSDQVGFFCACPVLLLK